MEQVLRRSKEDFGKVEIHFFILKSLWEVLKTCSTLLPSVPLYSLHIINSINHLPNKEKCFFGGKWRDEF